MHICYWTSSNQRRVSHSPCEVEILACTEAEYRGYYIGKAFKSTLGDEKINHTLIVDSKVPYDTITTLHEGRNYRLRQTIQRLRDSFEANDLNKRTWIQGKVNISDALAKRNPYSRRMLYFIVRTEVLTLRHHYKFSLISETWIWQRQESHEWFSSCIKIYSPDWGLCKSTRLSFPDPYATPILDKINLQCRSNCKWI